MPEETQPTQGVPETPAAETPAAGSQPVEQTPAVSEPAAPSGEPAKRAESKPAQQGDPASKSEAKPVSRRSAAYRIQQLAKENADLKQQIGKPTESPTVDEWGNPIAAGTPPDPKIAKLEAEIEALKGMVQPVMTSTQKAADDAELGELFAGKPEEKAKYEDRLRTLWNEPQYKDLAASDLYKIATYDEAIANARLQAVEDYKKAAQEAKEASASGSSNTSNRTGNSKSPADMTDEELQAHNERIKAGIA